MRSNYVLAVHVLFVHVCSCSLLAPTNLAATRFARASPIAVVAEAIGTATTDELDQVPALQTLAKHALAMLASSDADRDGLMKLAEENKQAIADVLLEYDVSRTGQLEAPEAEALFTQMAVLLLREAAQSGKGAAASHAQSLLAAEDSCEADGKQLLCSAVTDMAGHLLRIADKDGDGSISLSELAELFEGDALLGSNEAVMAQLVDRPNALELYELRGCLQMLPRIARHFESDALQGESWHDKVAGDSHTMMRWISPTHSRDGLSIVGLGRSADASCYYLPEWGLVLVSRL